MLNFFHILQSLIFVASVTILKVSEYGFFLLCMLFEFYSEISGKFSVDPHFQTQ